LSVTKENGQTCALCSWEKFCRGCNIPCDEKPLLHGVQGFTQMLSKFINFKI
jgi:ubiquitin carboxyl-terminal hydrolase 6/32